MSAKFRILLLLLLCSTARASLILPGLIGGDLTDPENNGAADADVNYNATFASDNLPGFGTREKAFNVFDNLTGGNDNKWCCDDPSPGNALNGPGHQLDATLLAGPFVLTHFTMTSSNDTPARDPLNWQILGSNDGTNFTVIFNSAGTNFWPTGTRNQTIRFDGGTDFPTQAIGYSTFRYSVTESVGTTQHALSEIEYFGVAVPEPSSGLLFALALLTGWQHRRRA
jgi:hypothetical protein